MPAKVEPQRSFKSLTPEERERRQQKVLYAYEMRQNPTPAEDYVWEELRAGLLDGYRFRRQSPRFGYILDFYCSQAGLAIEIDGPYHETPEQAAKDRRRDGHLAGHGIKTLRFTNDQVTRHWSQVHRAILAACKERCGPARRPRETEYQKYNRIAAAYLRLRDESN